MHRRRRARRPATGTVWSSRFVFFLVFSRSVTQPLCTKVVLARGVVTFIFILRMSYHTHKNATFCFFTCISYSCGWYVRQTDGRDQSEVHYKNTKLVTRG